MKNDLTDDLLLNKWYQYAAKQKGFVGIWLRRLREQQKITLGQQRNDFGANEDDFAKLQGMPLPRPNQFTKDARRIAESCHLANPSAFVKAMLLARSVERNSSSETNTSPLLMNGSYQAAYDADDDLDKPLDEDDE
ncbi:MAG: hypothetical protein HS100_04400 [Anaerolineales bacterium]|nr:hypothetical protein [Anaerolineales bacterium]